MRSVAGISAADFCFIGDRRFDIMDIRESQDESRQVVAGSKICYGIL